jgi:hypothetical protein
MKHKHVIEHEMITVHDIIFRVFIVICMETMLHPVQSQLSNLNGTKEWLDN